MKRKALFLCMLTLFCAPMLLSCSREKIIYKRPEISAAAAEGRTAVYEYDPDNEDENVIADFAEKSDLFYMNSSGFENDSDDGYYIEDNTMKNACEYGYTTVKSRLAKEKLYYTLKKFTEFDSLLNKKSCFVIPGLENTYTGKDCQSMIPQGICTAGEYFITTAYDDAKELSSVLYVVSNDAKKALRCVIELPVRIHAGGIAFDGDNIWICGNDEVYEDNLYGVVYRASLDEINNLVKSGSEFACLEAEKLQKCFINNTASFCTYYAQKLWVGTYAPDCLDTATYGCMISYDTQSAEEFGDALSLKKENSLILPNRAQGACFVESEDGLFLLLSRSYARNSILGMGSHISEIRIYKPDLTVSANGILKKGNAVKTIAVPPMIEEICFNNSDNMLYAMFESGASKYGFDGVSPIERCLYIFDRVAALDLNALLSFT